VTFFLTVEEALAIGAAAIGGPIELRDAGLLEAALARPRASVFGRDAYPSLDEKGAALLQSLVGNHALVDGNERIGFAGVAVFLAVNGAPLTLTEDEAYDLVMEIAGGDLTDVGETARRLRPAPARSATSPPPGRGCGSRTSSTP
jgi:death-on-curing protein